MRRFSQEILRLVAGQNMCHERLSQLPYRRAALRRVGAVPQHQAAAVPRPSVLATIRGSPAHWQLPPGNGPVISSSSGSRGSRGRDFFSVLPWLAGYVCECLARDWSTLSAKVHGKCRKSTGSNKLQTVNPRLSCFHGE